MRLLLSQASSMVSQNTVRFWTQDNPANPQAVRHKPPRRPERRCQVPYQSPNLRRQSKKGDAPQSLRYSPAPPAAGEVPEAVQRPLKSLSFAGFLYNIKKTMPKTLHIFADFLPGFRKTHQSRTKIRHGSENCGEIMGQTVRLGRTFVRATSPSPCPLCR